MTDEVVVPAEVSAPDVVETASTTEASVSEEAKPVEKPRVFTQEELDAAISKRLAREERKWQREQAQRPVEAPKAPDPVKPVPGSFTTTEDYIEAVAEWKADQKITERLTQKDAAERQTKADQEATEAVKAYRQKEEAVRDKYDDYEDVVYNPSLPITDAMASTIQESDNGPELVYFLGKNPQEAARIAKLSPFLQAKELGRLEAKLPQGEPKKTSSAPEPIKPVNSKGGSQPVFDTTDPRSTKGMSTSEWIAADRERQRKKLEAQGYR